MVASTNSDFSQYPASLRMNARQDDKEGRSLEEIMDLGDMLNERLEAYKRHNQGRLPKRIIFFRDGVSTDQFAIAKGPELQRLQYAIRQTYRRDNVEKLPETMLICTVKRHGTRFYPHPEGMNTDHHGPRTGNPISGTVFFNTVTYGRGHDFFLISQDAAIGTANPTHYIVLHNDIGTIQDSKQKKPRSVTSTDIARMVGILLPPLPKQVP